MFKKNGLEVPADKVNTIIGKDTVFSGTINGKGLIRIDGKADGTLQNQGDVVIGESGSVTLEIHARHVTIAGRYEGTLEADGKLELKKTGTAIGTFKANALVIEQGAVFSGTMEMKHDEGEVKVDLSAEKRRVEKTDKDESRSKQFSEMREVISKDKFK